MGEACCESCKHGLPCEDDCHNHDIDVQGVSGTETTEVPLGWAMTAGLGMFVIGIVFGGKYVKIP